MRFVLSTIGTLGDVLPFVEIAAALRGRGHQAVLLANANFQELIERHGIEFHALGGKDEYLGLAQSNDFYHALRGVKEISARWILPSIRKTLDYVAAHRHDRDTVLVGAAATVGLRIAQELYNLPVRTLVLSPFMLPSVHVASVSPGLSIPAWSPRFLKRAFQSIADRGLDGLLKPGIEAVRKENGSPPLPSTVRQWWLSPDRVIGLFPEWFAPVQPDWPRTVTLTNFLPPPAQNDGLAPELESFLAGEERLAVITMGSILAGKLGAFQAIVQACLSGGFKCLLLSSNPNVLGSSAPPRLKQLAFAPLRPVLERASLIVHHAGIGTASLAIAAGTPQLLLPHGHDQFDNASRLVRLGVAKVIRANMADEINGFLSDRTVAASCQRARELYASGPGLDEVCRLLEERI